MHKIRVGVLRGGPSDEYEVSLRSGASVLSALDRNIFDPLDIVITKGGEWIVNGYEYYPERILGMVDIIFNALHGTYGEDGTVQRLLDRHGIKYTGSGAFPSSVAMHKGVTKDRIKLLGIKTPPYKVVTASSKSNTYNIANMIGDLFGPEYIVKPVAKGSSVGVKMIANKTLLAKALSDALAHDHQVLVEQYIPGKEATCGVIENFRSLPYYTLPPIEIIPPTHATFYDNTVKYDGSTQMHCPARFSRETKDEIEKITSDVHQALDLSQYSRSDFIVADDGVYFLEVNTLPGLTDHSLFPAAIQSVGGNYQDLITHLLTDRLER